MVRRLVVMGSGEATPGMLGVHRRVFAGLPEPTRARLLDSPFAFQENADELVERLGAYFAESVGRPLGRITLPAGADALTVERALAEIQAADWVFAGPGSPSYARRCWLGTGVPAALASVVDGGRPGALVLASAAAVTLGDWALPVYEIYKVGEDPRWEPGIGLMREVLGWRCAVVPHYDNQEGGTHDTRFCYVGGRRLGAIEPDLDGAFILGVDEHTALILDLEAGTAEVAGRGTVTLRVAGVEDVIPSGSALTILEVEERIKVLGATGAVPSRGTSDDAADRASRSAGQTGPTSGGVSAPAPDPDPDPDPDPAPDPDPDPDPATVDDLARTVLAALPDAAPEARAALVALAGRAEESAAAQGRELADRLVQALVQVRFEARARGDWAASDRLRDLLAETGVEVRDTREGTEWVWR